MRVEGRDETWPPGGYGRLGGPGGPPEEYRTGTQRRADAGVAGNARLTAANAAVLLVLLAAEGVTILRVHKLMPVNPHFWRKVRLLVFTAFALVELEMLIDEFHPGCGVKLFYLDSNLRIARDIVLISTLLNNSIVDKLRNNNAKTGRAPNEGLFKSGRFH